MKVLKLSFLSALAIGGLVAFAPYSRAQDTKDTQLDQPATGQRARHGGQTQFDRMAAQLKLSPEQKVQLRPIFQEEAKKLKDLRQDSTLTARDRKNKATAVREQYAAKIKEHLTAEQFVQYQKLRQAGPSHTPHPAAPAPKIQPDESTSKE